MNNQIQKNLKFRYLRSFKLETSDLIITKLNPSNNYESLLIQTHDLEKKAHDFRKRDDYYFNKDSYKLKTFQSLTSEQDHKSNMVVVFEEVIYNPELTNKNSVEELIFGPPMTCQDPLPLEMSSHEDLILEKDHILFMVHGLHGSSLDLAMIKDKLSLYNERLHIVLCSSNENTKASDNLDTLGSRLADEVRLYLVSFEERRGRLDYRISFLGFSLGRMSLKEAG